MGLGSNLKGSEESMYHGGHTARKGRGPELAFSIPRKPPIRRHRNGCDGILSICHALSTSLNGNTDSTSRPVAFHLELVLPTWQSDTQPGLPFRVTAAPREKEGQ